MYTAKHALLYKHKVHDGQAVVFYMDVRAPGKGYDEFVRRAVEEDEVLYLRGRVSRLYEDKGQIVVSGVDTLSAQVVEIRADLVVLATAIRSQQGANRLAQHFGVGYDAHAFYSEAHPKLRPVESAAAGVFLAGACQGPKDIPESVAQASATAAKVGVIFSREILEREPIVARVNEAVCAGCFACREVCPYGAVEVFEVRDRQGRLLRKVARVNAGVCNGCGTCQATCPSKSVELAGYTDEQIFAQIAALRP
jgi:heterodisulfide reductase subunit A